MLAGGVCVVCVGEGQQDVGGGVLTCWQQDVGGGVLTCRMYGCMGGSHQGGSLKPWALAFFLAAVEP